VSRRIQSLALAMILLGLTASDARAELAVNIGSNNNVVAGTMTGAVDITLSSNSMDQLIDFGLELQIKQISGTGILQFATAQPVPYANSNYVFSGHSSNADFSLPLWDVPNHPPNPFVQILGGDSDDGTGLGYVTIPSSPSGPNSFLGTVQFNAVGAVAGDVYQISLVTGSNTFFDGPISSPSYTSNVGTITIARPAAVPEPSSLTMMALSSLSGLLLCYGRRRQRHSQS
jgi:hypothetical protein